jgi:predicted nucleic acid-binding protein
MLLLDTSAWVEFFQKTERGEKVKHYLKKERCFTSIVSIAEISHWARKQKLNSKELVGYITSLTEILNLTLDIAFLAGELNFERKRIIKNWGMLDSFILATAARFGLKILTKDSQFQDLPNLEIL